MPEICRFFGIVITMYYREHGPPHFHARYGRYRITVGINDGVVEGEFPRRALSLVLEWWNIHRHELAENWKLAESRQHLAPIEPLE